MFPHVWNILHNPPSPQLLANGNLLLHHILLLFSIPLSRRPYLGAKKKEKRTSMISFRTFGTSEKKNNANTPAATPNDAAVSPLSPMLSASQRICPHKPRMLPFGARKGGGVVICTIVLYSWDRFPGCWVGFYSFMAAISSWAPGAKD